MIYLRKWLPKDDQLLPLVTFRKSILKGAFYPLPFLLVLLVGVHMGTKATEYTHSWQNQCYWNTLFCIVIFWDKLLTFWTECEAKVACTEKGGYCTKDCPDQHKKSGLCNDEDGCTCCLIAGELYCIFLQWTNVQCSAHLTNLQI